MGHVKTFFPKTRLSELAARGGGILRSDALEAAQSCIEGMRAEGDAKILTSIGEIETIALGMKSGVLHEEDLRRILRLADQTVTLAGTFGYNALDSVVRSLCDLADGMIDAGIGDAAPVIVHVQSMRLVMPGSVERTQQEILKILAELAKVVAHYDIGTLAIGEITDVPGAAAN